MGAFGVGLGTAWMRTSVSGNFLPAKTPTTSLGFQVPLEDILETGGGLLWLVTWVPIKNNTLLG